MLSKYLHWKQSTQTDNFFTVHYVINKRFVDVITKENYLCPTSTNIIIIYKIV